MLPACRTPTFHKLRRDLLFPQGNIIIMLLLNYSIILVILVLVIKPFIGAQQVAPYTEFKSAPEDQEFRLSLPVVDIQCCYSWCGRDTCRGFVYRDMERICLLMLYVYTVGLVQGRGTLGDGRVFIKSDHFTNTLLARSKIRV